MAGPTAPTSWCSSEKTTSFRTEPGFEDTDLGERIREAGWGSAVCEGATIVHHGHMTVALASAGSVWEWQMLRSQYLYFCKHRGRLAGLLLSGLVRGALLIRVGKALVMCKLSRDPSERETASLLVDMVRYDPRTLLHPRNRNLRLPRA